MAEVSDRAAWVDGRLVDPDAPQLQADDHGVLTGDGVFETMVVTSGAGRRAAFAVGRHLRRLHRSAAAMELEVPYGDDELRGAIDGCLRAAPGAGLVRLTVTSGGGPLSSVRGDRAGSVIVVVGAAPPAYQDGTAVAVAPFPRNERGGTAGVKTTSYAENVLALRQARAKGATEAIFADTRGRVSEGTGTNIFWTDGAAIHTPPLDTGCLAGVTRELVMELVEVTETHLAMAELRRVPEAFLTSSTRGVQSIGRVDETDLPVTDGELTQAAAQALRHLMATDIDP